MGNKIYIKNCKKCISKEVIKFWMKRWKQIYLVTPWGYKCKYCNHIFCNSSRKKNNTKEIYKDFSKHKQTYTELSEKYWISIKYLFIWYDYIWKVDIPNTTNWLEWFFSHLKTKIRIHRWLKKERKMTEGNACGIK